MNVNIGIEDATTIMNIKNKYPLRSIVLLSIFVSIAYKYIIGSGRPKNTLSIAPL